MKSIIFSIIFLCVGLVYAAELTGKVVSVSDGDTITVLDQLDKGRFRIRLGGIDAPEKSQDFGQVSKKKLSELIFGKTVTVRFSSIDRYGRIVGFVRYGSTDVNLTMIQSGLAWHYSYFYKSDGYANAEIEARSKKIGLWSMPNPLPPWQYRKQKK